MQITFALDQIAEAAQQVVSQNPHKVILLHGHMGAGKTTFVKAFAKALGVADTTGSPTFSLVNEYRTGHGEILYHFDVYRLKSETEAYDMGMDEYLYSGHWCLVEWAEKIPRLVPETHSVITIEALANGNRTLTLS